MARATDILIQAFLGTGIVRAYFAEAKGPRGLRAIVHPSVAPDLFGADPLALIELPPDEIGPHGVYEVNIAAPFWRRNIPLAARGGVRSRFGLSINRISLERMKEKAPEQAKHGYDATIRAFDRMSARLAEAGFDD